MPGQWYLCRGWIPSRAPRETRRMESCHGILHRTWRKPVPRLTGTSIARRRTFAGRSALSLSLSMFVSECSRRPPAREARGNNKQTSAFTHRLRNRTCAKRERSLWAHDRSGIRGAPCPRRNVLEMRRAGPIENSPAGRGSFSLRSHRVRR